MNEKIEIPGKMKQMQIDRNFTYHSPTEMQIEKYQAIGDLAKTLAYFINETCPDGREKSLSVTNLEQAVLWANAAIARNEE